MPLIPAPGMQKQKDNSVSIWATYGDPVSKEKIMLMIEEGNNQLRFNNVGCKFLQ